MKPLVIANWKMNPPSRTSARDLALRIARNIRGARGVEVAIAPPFPFLETVRRAARSVRLAGQDVFSKPEGPFTGAVSPPMLRDLGVSYCIVGHSERRRHFCETNESVNQKVKALLAAGITPVVAIGEDAGEANAVVPKAIATELHGALAGVPRRLLRKIVVAYEPVWAISTNPGARPDTPDNATRRAIYIRKLLAKMAGGRIAEGVRIIYGGSTNAKNAASFIADDIRGMDGVLVGGASLRADEFGALVKAVAARRRRP
ncbi:MAG: triose-phosphate isomerase [Candidatus Sungbacteria bacterium RIFCSPLOWO2_01_FULL_60_25]|uniref:Triosephosphate isomerase n=1 Tax=Candidatus Sungbacteria bacterium RIFCSPLOWO2_01_FULL_60_25 TaxID=1802281 RepID=A0A1G2LEA9_9BACT|nr:MAG: triose-phosphate isomerase [Candidatus Sungbacteria bacterium RIFCSPLOWO2_01_FULL_60_25]